MSQITARDRRRSQRRLRPSLMALEGRRLLSTIVVNNATDTPVVGQIDLRQAIGQANAAGGVETINFDQAVFSKPQTITLSGTQLELSTPGESVTITGPAGGVTVSGGGLSRVFQIDSMVSASISGLTITGGVAGYSYGGGVYNMGTTSLTNCTVTGNSANFIGGGVANGSYSNQGVSLTLINCTVSGNSSNFVGGLFTLFGSTTATNTIIAGNDYDLFGPLDPASTNNLIGGDPVLAPLGLYGGTGETMALLPGSPAIGAGTSGPGIPSTDERGVSRVGAVDIGAFQSSGFTIAATSGSGQTASGAFAAPLAVTVVANNPIEPVAGGLVTFTAPSSGASATSSVNPAVIAPDGTASVTATSNFIGGSYTVTATAAGATGTASFGLTNDAVVSIAVSPGNPSLAVGVSGQSTAVGTFTDGLTHDITDTVAWSSATPSAATIGATGVATGVAVGTSQITASWTGVASPADTVTVIAPSFVVNTTDDALGFYSGTTSLREAIASADVVPGQTITFDKTVFKTSRTITLGGTPLELTDTTGTTTIVGPRGGVTVSGGGLSGVFQVDSMVTASFSGLTITGGKTSGNGGGVLSDGNTTLTRCTITGNSAGGSGGGLDFASGTASLLNATISGNTAASGGGVASSGSFTMVEGTVSDNTATGPFFYGTGQGGGLDLGGGPATLTGCTIIRNQSGAVGGGLYDAGATLNMADCVVSDNSNSFGGGGGVSIIDFQGGTATLAGCTISGNTQSGGFLNGLNGGGGLAEEGVTLTMTGDKVSGNQAGAWGGGLSLTGGTTTLTNCTVSGNSTLATPSPYGGYYGGGGLWVTDGASAVLNNCSVSGDVSGDVGGAIFDDGSYGPSKVAVNGGKISGNSAGGDGGGLFNFASTANLVGAAVSGNSAADGGGVATQAHIFTYINTYISAGTTDLTGCTVSGNTATGTGGGLENDIDCTTTAIGTTVTNNSAAAGGGIANQGTLSFDSGTIDKNEATSKGGGVSTTGGTATITNSSISNNQVNAPATGTALGGGIDSENTTLSLSGVTIKSNQANGATALGGGLYLLDGSADVEDCTIRSNQANGTVLGEGGGIFDDGGQLTLGGSTTVKKNKASNIGNDIFIES